MNPKNRTKKTAIQSAAWLAAFSTLASFQTHADTLKTRNLTAYCEGIKNEKLKIRKKKIEQYEARNKELIAALIPLRRDAQKLADSISKLLPSLVSEGQIAALEGVVNGDAGLDVEKQVVDEINDGIKKLTQGKTRGLPQITVYQRSVGSAQLPTLKFESGSASASVELPGDPPSAETILQNSITALQSEGELKTVGRAPADEMTFLQRELPSDCQGGKKPLPPEPDETVVPTPSTTTQTQQSPAPTTGSATAPLQGQAGSRDIYPVICLGTPLSLIEPRFPAVTDYSFQAHDAFLQSTDDQVIWSTAEQQRVHSKAGITFANASNLGLGVQIDGTKLGQVFLGTKTLTRGPCIFSFVEDNAPVRTFSLRAWERYTFNVQIDKQTTVHLRNSVDSGIIDVACNAVNNPKLPADPTLGQFLDSLIAQFNSQATGLYFYKLPEPAECAKPKTSLLDLPANAGEPTNRAI